MGVVAKTKSSFSSFQPRMLRKQITPVNSPQKERYGDRFIPSRAGNNWQVNFNMIQVSSRGHHDDSHYQLSVIFLTR